MICVNENVYFHESTMLHSRVRLQHLMRKSLYHYRLSVSRFVVSLSLRAVVHLWRLKWYNSIIKWRFINSVWICRLLREFFIHIASGVAIVISGWTTTTAFSIYGSFNIVEHANPLPNFNAIFRDKCVQVFK